jgi:hypothetical protein
VSRTKRTAMVEYSIWPTVESWAESNKFKEVESTDSARRFSRGTGKTQRVQISQSESNVVIEAWIETSLWFRLWLLFLLPKETHIDSGIKNWADKKRLRNDLNPLFSEIGIEQYGVRQMSVPEMASETKVCDSCKAIAHSDAKFCRECGTALPLNP